MPSNRCTPAQQDGRTFAHQDGIALVATMMAITLLATLAATLLLSTMTEAAIAVSYREGTETFYAAESAMEYVVSELRTSANWSDVISGKTPSAFVDGPPGGTRSVGATIIDFARAMADVNSLRPRGAPLYRPYAYGRLSELIPLLTGDRPAYAIVWVADRSAAGGTGVVLGLFAQAYGPTGARRAIEATVARAEGTSGAEPNPVRFVAWSEIR